jgi:hypothetical protein
VKDLKIAGKHPHFIFMPFPVRRSMTLLAAIGVPGGNSARQGFPIVGMPGPAPSRDSSQRSTGLGRDLHGLPGPEWEPFWDGDPIEMGAGCQIINPPPGGP